VLKPTPVQTLIPNSTISTATPASTFSPLPLNAPGQTQVIGFYVNWDDNSFTSLKQNINSIDKLIPEWLHLVDASGAIVEDDSAKQQRVLNYIQQVRPDLPIVPLINNYDNNSQDWQGNALGEMLSDPTARAKNIQSLLDYVQKNHFAGISIDFESIPAKSQADLALFMQELYNRFHPLGLEVSESMPADDPEYDYPKLSQFNDYMIIMVYDEHWSSGEPGPISSQQWFANILKTRFAEVDPSKIVIGIGNYGYDWTVGANSTSGQEVSYQQSMQLANDNNAHITLDPVSLNATFDYTDGDGLLHHVWFLDAVSAFNQVAQTHQYQVKGIALWRMGSEDPSIWQVFSNRQSLNKNTADSLSVLHYGYGITYQGAGEILKVLGVPKDGLRSITYQSQTGLITNEVFWFFPSGYVIERRGGNNDHKIVLTFDDGPDATWTPQILDILKQYKVPATFFVIGTFADLHPDVLRQIVADGNEIGNHTFTHPDLSVVSDRQVSMEINATQRLFEGILGRKSVLFRPPYEVDMAPNSPDQVKPLLFTSNMGYYTIDMQIDPKDYLQSGVDKIVEETFSQAASSGGNVILLHDGGGDRTQTIAALPMIIQGLRSQGYQFVTISDLMGLTRDQIMPFISPSERVLANIDSIGFQTIGTTNWFLSLFFIVGIFLGILRFLSIAVLASVQKRKSKSRNFNPDYQPAVSILVPAYNEAKVIDKTINSLLQTNYSNFEIVVVDDGSTDSTYERAMELFKGNPKVKIHQKPNGGKAQALNFGIEQSTSEIVVVMDADTIIRPDAVFNLIRHFSNPKMGAVAGNAKVGNRINLLTNWQALEYVTGQNLDRRAFDLLNSISVVPGAIGAWRRDILLSLGGFTDDTLAEDADMTLKILRRGYKIEYEENAIALTEAPDTVGAFLKQRFRWMFGTLQASWKHRDTLFRRKYGAVGMATMPNILIFQIFFPFISPLMDLTAIGSIAWMVVQSVQHPLEPAPIGLVELVFFYVLFVILDFLTALVAFSFEREEDWRLIIWLFPQRFFYRQLMYYVAIKSVITAIRGKIVGWGKLERKATVKA
jgi:cellulose synthase/poly-beta-1,6-N-acetylglucosamine synthase-like glycosyltransferase/spore germination protein YaaH/peptidoglycan/xylan/chitin deacetylase (PgdA/CDA1 family)